MKPIDQSPILDIAAYLDAPDVLPSGKLCLEFANTADWHAAEQPIELITSYGDLVAWAQRVEMISAESAESLRKHAATQPALAAQIHAWAIELREAIYHIFVAHTAYASPELVATATGYSWHWRADEKGLDGILWPILRSTARLLTDGDLTRVGQCADDRGCGYLFYDTSRNRSRRWCDMNACGNRAKSQRHYARHRNSAPERT